MAKSTLMAVHVTAITPDVVEMMDTLSSRSFDLAFMRLYSSELSTLNKPEYLLMFKSDSDKNPSNDDLIAEIGYFYKYDKDEFEEIISNL